MHEFARDLRFVVRMALKSPVFTLTIVACLALGIGASGAMFSVVDAVLMRALPYPHPEDVVIVWNQLLKKDLPRLVVSEVEFLDYRERNRVFERLAAFTWATFNITGGEGPERIRGSRVSADFFAVLGTTPIHGRSFLPEEFQPGADPVVLLNHGLWIRRFGGDVGIVGRDILLNDIPYRVAGVLPEAFSFLNYETELWTPMAFDRTSLNPRKWRNLVVVGRLGPGVTLDRASAEMAGVAAELQDEYPEVYLEDSGWGVIVLPILEQLVGDIRPSLIVLSVAVGIILFVSCLNVINLLLIRSASRRNEIAVRVALGGGRGNLLRLFFLEYVLLALLGSGLGLGLCWLVNRSLEILNFGDIPRLEGLAINDRVVVFVLGISLLVASVFTVAALARSGKLNLGELLRQGGGKAVAGRKRRLLELLAATEVAMAMVVLVGSIFLAVSFVRLQSVDSGIDEENLLTFRLTLSESKYPEPHQVANIYHEIERRLTGLPGARSCTLTSDLPMRGVDFISAYETEDSLLEGQEGNPIASVQTVSPGYFETLGIRALGGRSFHITDHDQARRVAIVDQALVDRFWPDEDPVGKRLRLVAIESENPWLNVVGVVDRIRYSGLDTESRELIYIPMYQDPVHSIYVGLRTDAEPLSLMPSVRREIWAVDPDLPIFEVGTMESVVSESMLNRRFSMVLLSSLGVVVMAMAVLGVYGVSTYSVSQRKKEIGVRVAIGASKQRVLLHFLKRGLILAGIGVASGMLAARALTRSIEGLLFDTRPTDPIVFASTAALLMGVVALASLLPAYRASRVDPVDVLRYE